MVVSLAADFLPFVFSFFSFFSFFLFLTGGSSASFSTEDSLWLCVKMKVSASVMGKDF